MLWLNHKAIIDLNFGAEIVQNVFDCCLQKSKNFFMLRLCFWKYVILENLSEVATSFDSVLNVIGIRTGGYGYYYNRPGVA